MSIVLPINEPTQPTLGNISGTWSFSVTRNQIIQQALLYIEAIGETEEPTAQETQDCAFALNLLVKQWMGKQDFAPGLKMWSRQRGDLFLGYSKFQYALGPTGDNWAGGVTNGAWNYNQTTTSAATLSGSNIITLTSITAVNVNDYIGIYTGTDIFWTVVSSINNSNNQVTCAANMPSNINSGAYVWNYSIKAQQPLEIVTSILRDINQNDIPQNKLTIEQYEALPTKTATTFVSDPTAFYYEFQLNNGTYNIDCGGAQDVTKHLHIVYLRPIADFDNPGDSPEYPQAWYRALCWGLARDVASMFHCEWSQIMENNYQDSLSMARETPSNVSAAYFVPGDD